MPTAYARLTIDLQAEARPDTPRAGRVQGNLHNGSKGRAWTNGTSSGEIGQVYRARHTIAAGVTVSFDTLAAGGLLDILDDAVDLDELKWLYIKVTSGSVRFGASDSNFLDFFETDDARVHIFAGQAICIDFGAAGLDVTTNSKFDITDIAGGAGSVVEVSFGGAQ